MRCRSIALSLAVVLFVRDSSRARSSGRWTITDTERRGVVTTKFLVALVALQSVMPGQTLATPDARKWAPAVEIGFVYGTALGKKGEYFSPGRAVVEFGLVRRNQSEPNGHGPFSGVLLHCDVGHSDVRAGVKYALRHQWKRELRTELSVGPLLLAGGGRAGALAGASVAIPRWVATRLDVHVLPEERVTVYGGASFSQAPGKTVMIAAGLAVVAFFALRAGANGSGY